MKKGFIFPEVRKKREETDEQKFTRLSAWVAVILMQDLVKGNEAIKLRWYLRLREHHDFLTLSDMELTVERIMIRWAHMKSRDAILDMYGEEVYSEIEAQEEAEYWGRNEVV